jgi:putative transposase
MPSYQHHPHAFGCDLSLAPFVNHPDLPLGQLLTADEVQQALDQHHVHFGDTTKAVFTPAILLWTWLWQCLSKAKSCSAAVIRTSVLLAALKLPPWSEDTGTYCRARAKLPVALLRQLALTVGQRVEGAAASWWLWHNRHVYLLDGSTATLADTPENQRAYPQSSSQQPGLGFPIIRFVVLLGLATATVQDLAYGPYKGKETGEPSLARQLVDRLRPGDVVVADRYYCSYWLVALLLALGVQVVFRMHQRRKYDFRRGQRLGREDHVVVWHRPQRPGWMTAEEYAAMPEQLVVRELRVRVTAKGCRTKALVLVTTLLDAEEFPYDDIGDLYHYRWHAELDLRSLKQTLGMDQLRCTAPELVERELWMHVLSYNLVRKVMAQAALWAKEHRPRRRRRPGPSMEGKDWTPREFSFTCAVEQVLSWWHENTTGAAEARAARYEALLSAVSRKRVGQRPGRCEPRAVKRRPKEYDRLMEPRARARARLLAEGPGEGDEARAGVRTKRSKRKAGKPGATASQAARRGGGPGRKR